MLGMGSGQPNRLESLRIAMKKAGAEVKGAALASDAFFPFGNYYLFTFRKGKIPVVFVFYTKSNLVSLF